MAQYACVEITAQADENIVPLLFKELTGTVPPGQQCKIQFIAFEESAGEELTINGVPNIVPSTGQFITPYDGANHMMIHSVTFKNGLDGKKIWFIF